MQSYFLAPHVYPCVTEDHVVLLDLARDKYIGVTREQMGVLADQVKGWSLIGRGLASAGEAAAPSVSAPSASVPGGAPRVASDNRGEAVLSKMLAAGMLTTDPAVGKEVQPLQMREASLPLIEPDLDWRPRVTFTDVTRFLYAALVTALAMRLLPIRKVISGAASRKLAAQRLAPRGLDVEVARRATEAFIRLRPLLFGAQDACLYDSLALARFLSYYGQFPSCVIGVHTGPFGAHCWVQDGPFVFNDVPETVRRFTPILAV